MKQQHHHRHSSNGGGAGQQQQQQQQQKVYVRHPWPIYTLVGTVSMACYMNALTGEFVHDDIPAIVLNKDVSGANPPLLDAFVDDFWGTPMADRNSHKSYRPLTILTFRANYLAFGLNPIWFHLTNVALHALAATLFTRVCLRVAALTPAFAIIAGLIFAVHPIHTEAVTGIVGRADVLACVFFQLSLLAYHEQRGKMHLWLSIFSGALSILAKETGITVFLVNLTYDLYKTWPHIQKTISNVYMTQETKQFIVRSIKIMLAFVILVAMRLALLQGSLPRFSQQDNPAAFHPSPLVRLLTFAYLAAFNWWLLLCPANLSHDWQMGSVPLITSISDARNLVTCLFFGLAAAMAVKCALDFKHQRNATMVLGLLLLVLPFLPATNLVVTVGFVIAERVLYIPSMGYILLTVSGVQRAWRTYARHRQTLASCLLLLLMAASLRCVVRNRDWRTRESLLRAGLLTLPHNAKMHYNFGNFLRDSSHHELAKLHYTTALRLWPTYASAHNNLGTLLPSRQDAERHFLLAIRFSKDHLNAHYNLGKLYRKLNRTEDSRTMLTHCMRIAYDFTPAYIEMARLLGTADRSVGVLLRKVVQLNPNDAYYINLYAQWLIKNGSPTLGLKYYARALSESPLNLEAIMGAARTLRRCGAHSRLFQLITRYQRIVSVQRGDAGAQHPHIYLHGWHFKFLMRNHSREYEDDAERQAAADALQPYVSDMSAAMATRV